MHAHESSRAVRCSVLRVVVYTEQTTAEKPKGLLRKLVIDSSSMNWSDVNADSREAFAFAAQISTRGYLMEMMDITLAAADATAAVGQ
jgi:hypothetical protein